MSLGRVLVVRVLVVCGAVFVSNYIGSVLGVIQQQVGLSSLSPGIGGAVLAGIPWFLAGASASILVAVTTRPSPSVLAQGLLILVILAQYILSSGVLQAGLEGASALVLTVAGMHAIGALVVATLIWWRISRMQDDQAA